jgi:oxygen-independent coproporphyrinogen-3 oxidase
MSLTTDGLGLYIHIPFCRAKCTYCDFNSSADLEWLVDDYIAALVRDLEQVGPGLVRTIYLGGGTPTVLSLSQLVQVLSSVCATCNVATNAEVTIEANPGTVDAEVLAGLRAVGVTRLSLGAQSFDDSELRLLGRVHTAAEAVGAFWAARQAGFDNVSMDLIYGLPSQSMASWQATLQQALALQPDHLSLYALTVEDGTPLAKTIARGVLPVPDPDLAAEMYELSEATLRVAGYRHYEISNWAKVPGLFCQHNLTYWRNEPYLGIGAGAHSWFGRRRWANVTAPADYVARVLGGDCPVAMEEIIDPILEMGEMMMMGLRLLEEGIEFERFCKRFAIDLRQWFADDLAVLTELGLIIVDDERVRLSRRGRLLGNQVFLRFLPG